MGKAFKTGQAKKAAGALDGVNKPENIVQNFAVIRFLLKFDQFNVDDIQTFSCLCEKLA